MSGNTELYYIWLSEAFGAASRTAVKLIRMAGSPEELFDGKHDYLFDGSREDKNSEFTPREIAQIKSVMKKRSLDEAERIIETCDRLGVSVLTPESIEYPGALKYLPDMPTALYVLGELPDCDNSLTVAVVGTRKMTDYGRNMAYSIGLGLTYGGAVVVSGMALGSDSMALAGAMDAGGTVIAVLGSGVDVVYPREHRNIYQKIIENGAVISEYHPGTPPLGRNFPVRNRIMSGLSDATVVVEADAQSGSLITARSAFDQGKKVFAVPGKIGESGSEGTNQLIRDGALTVLTAEDVLAEFEFVYPGSVSVQRAHSMLRGVNFEELSENSMARTRIGSRIGTPNFYGNGTYGGRKKRERDTDTDERGKTDSRVRVFNPFANSADETSAADNNQKEETQPDKVKKVIKNKKQSVNSEEKTIPAKKIELDMLDESEIKVYNKMKPSVPTLPDELVDDDTPVSDVLSALTMLEMAGAVESGGGGYFVRIQPDDIMLSEND